MSTPPSDSRTATPKAIELGHVVVNIATGEAGRVRRIGSPIFDTDATVVVEIGRLPWGREVEWLRRDVVLASEWERRKERAAAPIVELQPEDPSPIARPLHFRRIARELWRRGVRARVRTRSGNEVVGCFWGAEPRGDFLQLQCTDSDGVFTAGWVGVTSIEEFRPPRVDRRLRTAPHGDGLVTTTSRWAAWSRVQEKQDRLNSELIRELTNFRPHAAQRRFMDGPRGILNANPGGHGHFRRLWWDSGHNTARLTPGALKLAGARIQAFGAEDRSVAQAMADQIDFEWESRRWAEPPGDAEASSNGMGC